MKTIKIEVPENSKIIINDKNIDIPNKEIYIGPYHELMNKKLHTSPDYYEELPEHIKFHRDKLRISYNQILSYNFHHNTYEISVDIYSENSENDMVIIPSDGFDIYTGNYFINSQKEACLKLNSTEEITMKVSDFVRYPLVRRFKKEMVTHKIIPLKEAEAFEYIKKS